MTDQPQAELLTSKVAQARHSLRCPACNRLMGYYSNPQAILLHLRCRHCKRDWDCAVAQAGVVYRPPPEGAARAPEECAGEAPTQNPPGGP